MAGRPFPGGEPLLMASVISCAILMTVLLFVVIPAMYRLFPATMPRSSTKIDYGQGEKTPSGVLTKHWSHQ
jgi:antibiotic biosynthesis monooxygenase (ABM) superfamily enzyme